MNINAIRSQQTSSSRQHSQHDTQNVSESGQQPLSQQVSGIVPDDDVPRKSTMRSFQGHQDGDTANRQDHVSSTPGEQGGQHRHAAHGHGHTPSPNANVDNDLDQGLAQLSINQPSPSSLPPPPTEKASAHDALDALNQHRAILQAEITEDPNRPERAPLTEEGVSVFTKAGMEELLGTEDTVDLRTRVLTPVVHEHIRPLVHTEYTTHLEHEVHTHHIHPKILPVQDPSPSTQPTLHRIFSPQTQQWHELDQHAARLVLGDDVFFNGPQEKREERWALLPGFGKMWPGAGMDEGDGGGERAGGEEEEEDGFRWGKGGGKVWEREYVVGGNKGDWKNGVMGRMGWDHRRGNDE